MNFCFGFWLLRVPILNLVPTAFKVKVLWGKSNQREVENTWRGISFVLLFTKDIVNISTKKWLNTVNQVLVQVHQITDSIHKIKTWTGTLTLVHLSLEATKSLSHPLNKNLIFHLCEDFHQEVLIQTWQVHLETTLLIIPWPIPSICALSVETKHLANTMEFTHVRGAKDFSSVQSGRSCPTHVVRIRTVWLTKDNEIDVNTAGNFFKKKLF